MLRPEGKAKGRVSELMMVDAAERRCVMIASRKASSALISLYVAEALSTEASGTLKKSSDSSCTIVIRRCDAGHEM